MSTRVVAAHRPPTGTRPGNGPRPAPLFAGALLRAALALGVASPGPVAGQAFEVHEASIVEIQDALASGRTTSVALVEAYLARIRAYDRAGPALNAVIRLNPGALGEAEALDRERRERGPRGPLHGVPVLMKDNYEVGGLATSAGSIALAGWVPPTDAFIVRRLREAGAVVLGMTNMHELAAGITTIASLGGQTRNAYDPTRNPGGSSGGTGAAVAASFAAVGWGSDTCGSIRIPAAHHNLFGLRPSKGLFSTTGVIPLSHTQDVPGPLARTVTDLAIALDATVGPDPDDASTAVLAGRPLPGFREALSPDALEGVRLGVFTPYYGGDDAPPEEREPLRLVRAATEALREAGATVVEVAAPAVDSLLEGSSVIAYEFKWDLIDFLASRPGAPVRSLGEVLERGLHHAALESTFRTRDSVSTRTSEAYGRALARQQALREAVLELLETSRLDALVYPTMRRKPAPVGEAQNGSTCALSASTGFPAITLPAGFTEDGLPIGVELLARPFDDARLVAFGYAYERATQPRRPPPPTPPLVRGEAPAPVPIEVGADGEGGLRVGGRFDFDAVRGTLGYRIEVEGVPAEEIHAVTLDRMEGERKGAVLHRLGGPGEVTVEGSMALTFEERRVLSEGRLTLNVYTRRQPSGAARARLALPPSGS